MFAILKLILLKNNIRIGVVGIKHDITNTTRPQEIFSFVNQSMEMFFLQVTVKLLCDNITDDSARM